MPDSGKNAYLTPPAGERDLNDASNFSRFGTIHNAPEKRQNHPDSTEKSKRRDFFDPENIKVPAFSLDFVDGDDSNKGSMTDIRNEFSNFSSKIMSCKIGDSLFPSQTGVQIRM